MVISRNNYYFSKDPTMYFIRITRDLEKVIGNLQKIASGYKIENIINKKPNGLLTQW